LPGRIFFKHAFHQTGTKGKLRHKRELKETPMAKDLLTPTKLEKMKKTTAVGGGLYVIVSPDGKSKSYGFRGTLSGKQLPMHHLESIKRMSPEGARAECDRCNALIKKGEDPRRNRAERAAEGDDPAPTVSVLLDKYFEKKIEPERSEHDTEKKRHDRIDRARRYLGRIRTAIGKVLVADVNITMLRTKFPELEKSLSPSTNELRRHLQRAFDHAIVLEWRPTNPASKEILKGLRPEGYHKRNGRPSLAYTDAPRFVAELKKLKSKALGRVGKDLVTVLPLLFLVYTGVRTMEVREAKWGEIKWEKKLWEVPREHRKLGHTKNEIRAIPISNAMMAVLNTQKGKTNAIGRDDFIFPGGADDGGLGRGVLLRALNDTIKNTLKWDIPVTVHGFRSTLNTWAKAQRPAPYNPIFVKAQFDHLSKMSDDDREWLRASMADKHYSNSEVDPTIEGSGGRREMTEHYDAYLDSYEGTITNE
jgi:integrase